MLDGEFAVRYDWRDRRPCFGMPGMALKGLATARPT